jgi:hypothetical protein
MAKSKTPDKKSPVKKKSSTWNDFQNKTLKKLKKIGVIPKNIIAGTASAASRIRNLVNAGFSSLSQWLTLPGDKKKVKELEKSYKRAGYTVRNGKVMVNKSVNRPDEVLRMDKKTGLVKRYQTDLLSGERYSADISLAVTDDEIPPLGKNQHYRVVLARGKGRAQTLEYKFFDDRENMIHTMDSMYLRYIDWRAHYEIVNLPKSSIYYKK